MGKASAMFYAVARGRQVGVFTNWAECKTQVTGYNGARYKKFPTEAEALEFIEQHKIGGSNGNLSAQQRKIPVSLVPIKLNTCPVCTHPS